MIKKLLGIAPQQLEDGSYKPSPMALNLSTSSTTNYDNQDYPETYTGSEAKVLMLCTEEKHMTMKNGKRFSTGNHPVEMLVPLLHIRKAGFDVDVYTPTGKPVKIEMWAMPEEDEHVQKIYAEFEDQFEHPGKLSDFVSQSMNDHTEYKAIFIPGGHGAMLGLPHNEDVKSLVEWAYDKDLLVGVICHGPAALLAANMDHDKDSFIYKGYEIAAFPDSADKQTPLIGYLPGQMPWHFGEKLKERGVTIVNSLPDDTCHVDRKLISGASPKAANEFGKILTTELLKEVSPTS